MKNQSQNSNVEEALKSLFDFEKNPDCRQCDRAELVMAHLVSRISEQDGMIKKLRNQLQKVSIESLSNIKKAVNLQRQLSLIKNKLPNKEI